MSRSISNYPPEISGLIIRLKSVNKAERFAGLAQGTLGKIRDGKTAYTELTKQKILTAIHNLDNPQEQEPMPVPHAPVPDTAPQILKDLIRHTGSLYQARRALACSEATLKKVLKGEAELTPVWISRAKARLSQAAAPELTEAIQAHPLAAPPATQMPPFVPWDNKSIGTFTTQYGNKKATYKKVPMPIVDLVNKYGTMAEASRSMGLSASAIQNWLKSGKPFVLKRQQLVHAAMYGEPPTGLDSTEQFDEYRLDLAIVLCKAQAYDRIRDIAEILQGQLKFKRNTPAGWLLVYRIKGDDARKFKRLAGRDAQEITCP